MILGTGAPGRRITALLCVFHLIAQEKDCYWYGAYACVFAGLWAGCLIGFITEFYTSHSYTPVREVAQSCETGMCCVSVLAPHFRLDVMFGFTPISRPSRGGI